MELWVRSKSKIDLMCIRRVQYGNINSRHIIYGEDTTMYLGEYSTKERCLEIIDEIQNLLCQTFMIFKNLDVPKDIGKYLKPQKDIVYQANNQTPPIEYHEQSVVVYEMPQE